jgi:UDP-3-O-[3-hydroxymyristoyl] glucosamine N-acyltransferase
MILLSEILSQLKPIKFIGNVNAFIQQPIVLDAKNTNTNAIMWVSDENLYLVKDLHFGTLICSNKLDFKFDNNVNIIIVENPRSSFRLLLERFFYQKINYYVAGSAKISSNVKISKSVWIGENVIIEDNCEIGENVEIGHNSVIYRNTKIGNDVKIGSNCTIGGVGFGYEKDADGTYLLIPHIGNVSIANNVHIGNNTCIDRAVLGSTILQNNVKVDNLVHIAHGVNIGENSLIIANAMIGGSSIIGENVWVAPSTSIKNNIKIGNEALIGMGAVVLKNVETSSVVIGNPAKLMEKK